MKQNKESSFGEAVQEVGEELDEKDYKIRLQEFQHFMEDDGPEGKARMDQVIAKLEATIEEKCPAEHESIGETVTAGKTAKKKPAKSGGKKK